MLALCDKSNRQLLNVLFCFFFLKLLEKKKRVQLKDMGEDLECLCQIMKTVGPKLDHDKAKVCRTSVASDNSLVYRFFIYFFADSSSSSSP